MSLIDKLSKEQIADFREAFSLFDHDENGSISAAELNAQLIEAGISAAALGPKFLRFVTHLDITDADIDQVVAVLPGLLQRSLVA